MKKKCALSWVLFVLLMIGCGGGGSGTTAGTPTDSSADNPDGVPSASMGTITVQFPQEESVSKEVALITTAPATITATHARLVVRRTVIGDVVKTETRRIWDSDAEIFRTITGPVTYHHVTYDAYKNIKDGTIPGEVAIAVPPGEAYTLEVLTYRQNANETKTMVKYAKTNAFDILAGEAKSITISLLPIAVDISAPGTVISGFNYSVAVDINKYSVPETPDTRIITLAPAGTDYTTMPAVTMAKSSPLRSAGNLLQETSDNINPFTPVTVTGAEGATPGMVNFTFTPPVVATKPSTGDWHLGFTGTFYINDNLLKSAELAHWSDWVCNPEPTGNVSTLTPQGSVGVVFD